ncbi:MAG: enolase C-terminal domain-like protein [Planctomycetota bacterium]|nr:enolase C-terminal domain-like protein [Planctomycetota bacterium]
MITIRDVRVIVTSPSCPLVVVKIETSEPDLYGLGCATFSWRYVAIQAAVDSYLKPFLIGRDVARIEEHFQAMMVNGYWRNGPILNNAVSGVDMALWDIKGKVAGMPLYDLLGGKTREAAQIYQGVGGADNDQLSDNVAAMMERGIHYFRLGGHEAGRRQQPPEGALPGVPYHPRQSTRGTFKALEHLRNNFGDDIELIHDVHERLSPAQAVEFAKDVEQFRLYFLEDLLAPEDIEWFANVRAVCATPLAMGELFVHPREWTPLIAGRLIDFMRMHVSQMGGLTPARKAAILGECHGVKTAWHGPGDVSPVGHAAQLHLDLVSPNFGIQEFHGISDQVREVFPGSPEVRNGYLYPNDSHGIGIDIDEEAAARYPPKPEVPDWFELRLPDGSIQRP